VLGLEKWRPRWIFIRKFEQKRHYGFEGKSITKEGLVEWKEICNEEMKVDIIGALED
jgi:hypothetical protein